MCTVVLGVLWASSIDLVVLDVNVVPGGNAEGRLISEVTAWDSFYTLQRGKAQIIKGVNLFSVNGVAPEYNDKRLVVRVYILNPGEMGAILGSKHAYIVVMATDQTDDPWSEVSYGEAILSAERAYGTIRPEIPWDVGTFRIRATIVKPGGSPSGAQVQHLADLRFRIEVSSR